MFSIKRILIYIPAAVFFCSCAFADTTAGLIEKGNRSWMAGDYDEALKNYEEAAVENPESPYIYFNRGTAYYKKGDYTAAIEAFEKAALKSKLPEMEAKSRFNLGNSNFREAERLMDSDLKKALEYCQKSIVHYQDALKLDRDFKEAAENVEIVRLLVKNILDEIKKKEEEAEKKEKQSMENVRDLEQLIKRQENALEKNRGMSGSKRAPGEMEKNLEKLAEEQKKIADDTQKLSDRIRQQSAGQDREAESGALTHLNNALKEQEAAEGNLRNSLPSNAEKNQENAVRELKDALNPPEQGKDGQNQESGQQNGQESSNTQGQRKASENPENGKPSDEQIQDENQGTIEKTGEAPEDILDEERENQKLRRSKRSGGYRDVDKDW